MCDHNDVSLATSSDWESVCAECGQVITAIIETERQRIAVNSSGLKFLIDKTAWEIDRRLPEFEQFIRGQLLTPLTGYSDRGGEYAIDNGAFSRFDVAKWGRLLRRQAESADRCLFVTCPDIVGSAARTLDLWNNRHSVFASECVAFADKFCLVAQDGVEDMLIPWHELEWIFIGGGDPWKDSKAAQDVVRTAKMLGKFVHVGRVNTPKRFDLFADLGADTCDGSGVAMYDHMLENIAYRDTQKQLFD